MFGTRFWNIGRFSDVLPEMQRLQREMNRVLSFITEPYGDDEFPPMNVWISESDIIVTAEIPGIDRDQLDISITNDILTISGQRDREVLKAVESYHRQERNYGKFARTLQVPFNLDSEKAQAKYEKGILHIKMPRAESDKPKKITITTA
ncbi:MAG: Hsp20/alpha crystallin family protein [Syntrophales bacterium]